MVVVVGESEVVVVAVVLVGKSEVVVIVVVGESEVVVVGESEVVVVLVGKSEVVVVVSVVLIGKSEVVVVAVVEIVGGGCKSETASCYTTLSGIGVYVVDNRILHPCGLGGWWGVGSLVAEAPLSPSLKVVGEGVGGEENRPLLRCFC